MKHTKHFLLLFLLSSCAFTYAVEKKVEATNKEFKFTTVKEVPITKIQNQASSGTCWSYSGLALLESELLRQGKGEYELAPVYVARKNYEDKAVKYVRMHGTVNFAGGGSFADVIEAIQSYGIVPMEIYQGLNYGEPKNKHGEVDDILKAYVDAVIKNPNKKLSTAWFKGYNGILDAYFGVTPSTFTYKGVEYTPQTYAQSLNLNLDDYISLTSYTHHPFYTAFPIEVQDNWRWANSYNIPLDELMQVIDNAIDKGYTVGWAADVSDQGFSRNKNVAILPDIKETGDELGSDQAKWQGLSAKEKIDWIKDNLNPSMPQKKVTQALRQAGFDNYEITDDHGMLIYGTAKDQNGNPYYLVKNSWGTDNLYKGTWYVSAPFVELQTLSILVHKEAIPKAMKATLGL